MKRKFWLLCALTCTLYAQENVEWETATLRLAETYTSGNSPMTGKVVICPGAAGECTEQHIQSTLGERKTDRNLVFDHILARALTSLGREGFEVTGTLQLTDGYPTVLLKRKRSL